MTASIRFDAASLRCEDVQAGVCFASSMDAGWTSLLLKRYRAEGGCDAFETLATPDQTIVVTTHGRPLFESFRQGQWRSVICEPGSTGMTCGGHTNRLRWSNSTSDPILENVHLHIPQTILAEANDHYRQLGQRLSAEPLTAFYFNDPAVAAAVSSLVAALADGAPDFYAETAARWIAVHLLARHSDWRLSVSNERNPGTLTDRRLARALDFMNVHLAEPLSVEAVAREAGISVFHFGKLFRQAVGETPYRYLIRRRMETARALLETSDLPVARIARACGFNGAAHFGAAFRAQYGQTPGSVRQQRDASVARSGGSY